MQTPDFPLSFLLQVLKVIRDSQGKPEIVYPLLSGYLETLDDNFAISLQKWATITLLEYSPQEAEKLAIDIANFSSIMAESSLGNRSNNVEIAIVGNEVAITVLTRDAFPEKWATIQNNLGNAYRDRIEGDRVENLEKAIAHYQAALEIRTRDAFPEQWAATQINLAAFYSQRLLGDRAENLEKAMACCFNALQIYTREAFPQQWAFVQNNLATAYHNRIMGERVENLEQAISCCLAALQVCTLEDFPERWAEIKINLGLIYFDRIRGDQAENLEVEIHCYQAALQVYTFSTFPEKWAITQKNLGFAYLCRIHGERNDNLNAAIKFSLAALQVYTRETFPQDYAETQLNLGIAYQEADQLLNGYKAFFSTIEVVDFLKGKNNYCRDTKLNLSEKWAVLYQKMVEICLELAISEPRYYTQAFEYVEASKARYIRELLAAENMYSNPYFQPKGDIPPKVIAKLNKLRNEIYAELDLLAQSLLTSLPSETIDNDRRLLLVTAKSQLPNTIASQSINQMKKELDTLIKDKVQPIDPTFSTNPQITYSDIQTLITDKTVVIEWYFTSNRFIAFIITRQTLYPIVWQSSEEEFQKLIEFSEEYLNNYNDFFDTSGSRLQVLTRLEAKKSQITNYTTWRLKLDEIFIKIAEILKFDRLFSMLPETYNQIILIPHRFLHIFPLHALPFSEDSCLLDRFSGGVRYAASCGILNQIQTRINRKFSNFCGIQNPTKDLFFSDLEVEAICQYFDSSYILAHENATKENLVKKDVLHNTHCLHFACHANFDFKTPFNSSLFLAESVSLSDNEADTSKTYSARVINPENCLVLNEIFNLDFSQCRLVVLSACQTALTDVKNVSDEYIGLPGGFQVAGSVGVVGSLWPVDDRSTAFLMIKFYENLNDDYTVTLALNKAQLWLRDITKGELLEWIKNLSLTPENKEILSKRLRGYAEDKPFKFPFHWAAFCVTGQ
ncbi:CHAT domain-containing tetratricopeptide repeat protein [Microcoleus sp. Pol10D4]|uniref:CHAT domain-containing tetratricopeptide repeat protein n=1 Tax=Microcoleus sp. Pol10D4 TaxID=3055387 RepID=UPI002FD2B6F4